MKRAKVELAPREAFKKTFQGLSQKNQSWKVFSDFCEMSAISLSNAIFVDQEREDRYLSIIKQYDPDEQKQFSELLGSVVMGLESMDCDFLGEMFMEMELSNHWKGQFFTPIHLCRAMGQTMVDDGLKETIEKKGFVTVAEPACGAGATIIGLLDAMRDAEINYQQSVHVTAVDVDPTAAHMCFIQLALLHVPAMVYVGNTIFLEMRSVWKTPAHYMGLWDFKLKMANGLENDAEVFEKVSEAAKTAPTQEKQLTLL